MWLLFFKGMRSRWWELATAAAVVAVLSGDAVTMELLARAREEAEEARIDATGPPLTLAPEGTTSEALGRQDLGAGSCPPARSAKPAPPQGARWPSPRSPAWGSASPSWPGTPCWTFRRPDVPPDRCDGSHHDHRLVEILQRPIRQRRSEGFTANTFWLLARSLPGEDGR